MFTIRKDQLAALEDSWRADFYRRMAARLREFLPEQTRPLDDATLLARVADGDRRARKYGIQTERGIVQFLGLTFMAGPRFDELPQVQAYLRFPDLHPDRKMDILVDYLVKHPPQQKEG